jgi:hypothetical protein
MSRTKETADNPVALPIIAVTSVLAAAGMAVLFFLKKKAPAVPPAALPAAVEKPLSPVSMVPTAEKKPGFDLKKFSAELKAQGVDTDKLTKDSLLSVANTVFAGGSKETVVAQAKTEAEEDAALTQEAQFQASAEFAQAAAADAAAEEKAAGPQPAKKAVGAFSLVGAAGKAVVTGVTAAGKGVISAVSFAAPVLVPLAIAAAIGAVINSGVVTKKKVKKYRKQKEAYNEISQAYVVQTVELKDKIEQLKSAKTSMMKKIELLKLT